eukprot:m.93678 g.93678  ORF g.93678 m.93678 type:complete len:194 (+) comp36795_c0_seq4:869-1450(+)
MEEDSALDSQFAFPCATLLAAQWTVNGLTTLFGRPAQSHVEVDSRRDTVDATVALVAVQTVLVSATRLCGATLTVVQVRHSNLRERINLPFRQIIISAVDGQWSHWESWGQCSRSCSTGITTRYRQCDFPSSTCQAKRCPGSSQSQKKCCNGRVFTALFNNAGLIRIAASFHACRSLSFQNNLLCENVHRLQK